METIVELPLELPLEPGTVEVARVEIESVGVNAGAALAQVNDDLYAIAVGTRVEAQQRMIVKPQLLTHASKSDVDILLEHLQIVPARGCMKAN